MTPTENRAVIFADRGETRTFRELGIASGKLSDEILDTTITGGSIEPDHAAGIVTAMAAVKSLIEQLAEADPRMAAAIERAQDRIEMKQVEGIERGSNEI